MSTQFIINHVDKKLDTLVDDRYAIIMACCVVSRFCPLSRNNKPKKLSDILGNE